jgi:hypothetical protein
MGAQKCIIVTWNLVTDLVEVEMVEKGIFTWLHYIEKKTFEYEGLLQGSHRPKHTARLV